MKVIDLPRIAKRSDYDEAIAQYTELVRPRAISIYRVGNVHYPGLSDIDLLVVTDRCSIDNPYFYSALQRLPRRYLQLFLHDPFILPAWSLRVMRHTTHYAPELLYGREVLSPYIPSDEPDERWCRMLEGYCSYAHFAVRMRETQTLKGRMTVAVANAFRYQLADEHGLFGKEEAPLYTASIDALRKEFFEREDPEKAVLEAWELFARTFDAFDARVQEYLGAAGSMDAVAKARLLLHGELESPQFNREYAFRRAQAIDGYHQDLASMGFPYGHLFFVAAHPDAVQTRSVTIVGEFVRNLYRVRRRLRDYAGA